MEKHRAIPEGYMKVGELAKQMGITVRTLQYYDKEGLLSPSAESEGGFRLYTDKDMVKLIQILTLKQLGIPLREIKKRLVSIDTQADMANFLTEHETSIRKKIEELTESLEELKALKEEVLQMRTIDFKRYTYILANLQMKNDSYWIIKYMDDDILEHFESHFDRDSAAALIKTRNNFEADVKQLIKDGVSPDSERAQAFAEAFWKVILDITGSDALLTKFADAIFIAEEEMKKQGDERAKNYLIVQNFMQKALEHYIQKG